MRILTTLLSIPLLVGSLAAQCLNATGGTAAGLVAVGLDPAHDEGVSPAIDMLFGPAGFPMAGAAGPLTHAVVDSNGTLYLTSGGPAVDRVLYGAFFVDDLRGIAGASPRVFPFWEDLEGPSAGWAVNVDTSVAGRFKVNWISVEEYFSGGPQFSFSAALYATGVVELTYGAMPSSVFGFAGVSIGNAVGTGLETSVDLASGPDSGTLGLLFQETDGVSVPSFSDRTITFIPNGNGGYLAVVTCEPANNTNYGSGCYDIAAESFYQLFADAAVASAALQGNSMTLDIAGPGYVAIWNAGGASAYVPPVAPTNFTRSDDGQNLLDLSLAGLPALPVPGGSTTTLYVHDNGFISTTGATNDNGAWNDPEFTDFEPTPSFRNAPETAFWSWHDYNPFDVAGGQVGWHYDVALTTLYITWQGVENYSTPVVNNPGTIQFQFNLTTGQVNYVWLTVDTDTTSTFGSAHLIGYSPGGASLDPGSIVLATGLPVVTSPDTNGLALSASPAPVINPSTLVTYTASNIVEFQPSSGVYLSTMFLSVNPLPGGFDVFGILTNTPGCNAYIVTLDLDLGAQLTFAPTASWSITYDNVSFAPGNVIAAQAVALYDGAFPLANGENGGFVLSNGVRSSVQTQ